MIIDSIIIGGVTSLISKYTTHREEKAKAEIEITKEEARHKMELESLRIQKELGLEIANKEFLKTQLETEMQKIKSQVEAVAENRKTMYKAQKLFINAKDKTVAKVYGLMQPILTYSLLSILMMVVICGLTHINNPEKFAIFEKVAKLLQDYGIINLAEMAIGFWFGAAGIDRGFSKK